jgi:hypothetical protein
MSPPERLTVAALQYHDWSCKSADLEEAGMLNLKTCATECGFAARMSDKNRNLPIIGRFPRSDHE